MSINQDRVRIISFVKKRDDLSQEEFERKWLQHAAIFRSIAIVKKNVFKYEQMHKNHEAYKSMPGTAPHCDGIVLFELESFEKFFAIFEDEEYKNVVVPDELTFIDRPKCTILPMNFATPIDRERGE